MILKIHKKKIQPKLVTLFVLNENKSNDFIEFQFQNIPPILITLLVLNEDKSTDFKYSLIFEHKTYVSNIISIKWI